MMHGTHINTLQYDARYTHINTLQYDARYTQRQIELFNISYIRTFECMS